MEQIISTAIAGILTLIGICVTVFGGRTRKKPSVEDKRAEETVLAAIPTPATPMPAVPDGSAYKMASQALDELTKLSARLTEVERELSFFRRSYDALYTWAQRIITDWARLRQKDAPPPLPSDIHHP